jgi:hypothetical protein
MIRTAISPRLAISRRRIRIRRHSPTIHNPPAASPQRIKTAASLVTFGLWG